jgi:hypothetical protein
MCRALLPNLIPIDIVKTIHKNSPRTRDGFGYAARGTVSERRT